MNKPLFTVTGKTTGGKEWSKDYYGGGFDCSRNNLTSLVIPDGATFGGWFYCRYNNLTSLVIPEGATFGGDFDCSDNDLTSLVIPDGATFGGDFDCRHNNLTSLVIPDGTTFGGGFYCSDNDLTSLVIPDGATFGGGFYCSRNNLTSLVIPDGATFGGGFDCSDNNLTEEPKIKRHRFHQGEHTDRWIYADGILSAYDAKKQLDNLTVFIGKLYTVVIDENNISAHGEDLRQAMLSYRFKISDKDTSEYRKYNKDSVVSTEKAYEMYRVITGACEAGSESFIREHFKGEMPEEISISEIIEITEGKYGHKQFREFWD